MLFPYKYVPHRMDRMQRFINFIFYNVWCRAPKAGSFSLDLFDANPDLKAVMTTFYYSDKANAFFFYGHIQRIYDLFATLNAHDIKKFKRLYRGNNDIENICKKKLRSSHILRYEDLLLKHETLGKELASFFTKLYDYVDIAALKEKIGHIDDHYKSFIAQNNLGKCPFCGLSDLLGVYHSHREAYDHYLPKKLYPFNSINFLNLVPACHNCNSSYKTSKDPAFTPKDPARVVHRRKVFYPYANPGYSIEVKIDLSNPDVDHLEPADIQLSFGPPALIEEIETWKDVYGIEERYKAKCCSGDAKDWLEQIRILRDAHGIAPAQSLNTLQQQAEKAPFANSNFLKKAFLEACDLEQLFPMVQLNSTT